MLSSPLREGDTLLLHLSEVYGGSDTVQLLTTSSPKKRGPQEGRRVTSRAAVSEEPLQTPYHTADGFFRSHLGNLRPDLRTSWLNLRAIFRTAYFLLQNLSPHYVSAEASANIFKFQAPRTAPSQPWASCTSGTWAVTVARARTLTFHPPKGTSRFLEATDKDK